MRVRVEFTLEVDAAAWTAEYGTPAAEVRQDVQDWVRYSVREQLRSQGLLGEEDR